MTMTAPTNNNIAPGDIALAELRVKSLQDVQRETALRWAARAVAAVALGLSADEYRHEALEHAGLSGDDITLASVRQILSAGAVDARALEELGKKSLLDIQAETAFLWAWRAYAAYHLWVQNRGAALREDAIVYAHEAVEHAVLAGDDGVLRTVRQIIGDAKRFASGG